MGGSSGGDTTFQPYNPPGPGPGQAVQAPGTGNQIQFGFQGMPDSFPSGALSDAYNNIGSLYGGLGQMAPQAYSEAQFLNQGATNAGISQDNSIYGTGLGTQQQLTQSAIPQSQNIYGQAQTDSAGLTGYGIDMAGGLSNQAQNQISGMENQNEGQVNSLLNNYDQSFVQQLGPQGQLGQQLAGEYNNLGITPQSGAFQSALGNQLGTLGAQNALTLGQQALQPGINAQYSTLGSGLQGELGQLSQGLGSQQSLLGSGANASSGILSQGLGGQLSTAQQGTEQAGNLSNLGAVQNQQLGQQIGLSPLNYADQAAQQQSGIINEAANIPIDYFGSQNNLNFAQGLSNQNQATQNNASQMGLLGNILGSGAGLAAAGK